MRTTTLAAIAALATIATPAAAQRNAVASPAAPVVLSAARVVAAYEFVNTPATVTLPRLVTLADSAGTLTATAELASTGQRVAMDVTVIECDIILQTTTRDGLLTIVLDRVNEGGRPAALSGRWTLGAAEGKLVARGQR